MNTWGLFLIHTLPALTHVIDDEALALAKNKPSRVWMEGDSQIGRGGEELERAAPTDVPPQDAGGELLTVGDGYHVAVADVQSGHGEMERVRTAACGKWEVIYTPPCQQMCFKYNMILKCMAGRSISTKGSVAAGFVLINQAHTHTLTSQLSGDADQLMK